ncbi:hypothetical protein [Streptomyces sp. NPDC057740]|uniref:hypothetical protein n=1 Tax=Streptomyces sp. NPDC057740 TaxID=3346234 RepID=UPI0036853161
MSITDKFLNDVEGHLLLAATREEVRTAAARFSAPLRWLTEEQRGEVERRFEAEYLALARASWQRTAARAGGLRDEYEARYRGLRRRLLASCLLIYAAACGVLVLCLA